MNISVDLNDSAAHLRAFGYLSPRAAENLSVLLRDLGRMGIRTIRLDMSRCSPVCVAGLEKLLETKFELGGRGVTLAFGRSSPILSKVFGLMGLEPDGEPGNIHESAGEEA